MGQPHSITVRLETVTPLFLAGAEARGQPELRPPSIRGALRYWLRAALGGAVDSATQDVLDLVRRNEAMVFGSTEGESGGASAITLRIAWQTQPNIERFTREGSVTVRKLGRDLKQPSGRDYLYWSMAESGKKEKGNYQPPKQYYKPGTAFDLILGLRPGVSGGEQIFKRAVAALWLLLQLGGVGSRSRRTAGSLSPARDFVFEGLQFRLATDNVQEVARQLADGLRQVRSWCAAQPAAAQAGQAVTKFDVIHPETCRIWVLGSWASSERAVQAIGEALRDFRTYREPDHREVAKWLNGQAIRVLERAVFGLPLPFRYSEGGLSGVVQGQTREPAIDRRASPVWLKVSKTGNGHYVGVATLFMSEFLPHGEKLHAAKARRAGPPLDPPRDYHLIEQWITGGFPSCQEVHYA